MQEILTIKSRTPSNRSYILLKFALLIFVFFIFLIPASAQEEMEHYAQTYVGEAFNFDGKTIRFKEVLSDSRCPSDVTCVWAGEAKVLVEIFKNGNLLGEETISIGANTSSIAASLAKYFQRNYTIKAMSLSPYPKTSRKIKALDYQLQLKITEKLED